MHHRPGILDLITIFTKLCAAIVFGFLGLIPLILFVWLLWP